MPPAFTLRESRAIARYLCALHPSPLLPSPTDLLGLAKFEEAASHEVTSFDPLANRLAFEAHFKPLFGESTDEEVVQELRERLERVLDGMERMLGEGGEGGGRTYMTGDTFTLADVFYVPYMLKLSALYGEGMFVGREKLRLWWERVGERPSVKLVKTYGME
jgi:glutathione S-transferase